MPNQVCDFGADYWSQVLVGLQPVPASYWIAMASDEPGTAIDGTMLVDIEPADPAYARQEMLSDSDHWQVIGNGVITNLAPIPFGSPTVDGFYLSHLVLATASAGGDLYAYGELDEPQTLLAGQYVVVPPGSIAFQLVAVETSIVT